MKTQENKFPTVPEVNPFSSRFVQPGAIPYFFERSFLRSIKEKTPQRFQKYLIQALSIGQQVQTHIGMSALADSFIFENCRAQLLGPHGSGKSTFLISFAKTMQKRGYPVLLYTLHDQTRTLPLDFWRKVQSDLLEKEPCLSKTPPRTESSNAFGHSNIASSLASPPHKSATRSENQSPTNEATWSKIQTDSNTISFEPPLDFSTETQTDFLQKRGTLQTRSRQRSSQPDLSLPQSSQYFAPLDADFSENSPQSPSPTAAIFSALNQSPQPHPLIFLDGFEQLSYVNRYIFRTFCRSHHLGFLLSTHTKALGVPILFRTVPSTEILRRIIDYLLTTIPNRPKMDAKIEALIKKNSFSKDIRQILFTLYDEYEKF